MKRILASLLAASFIALGCSAQPKGKVVIEPVRFEDGTAVSGDAEADSLFAQDRFVTDTTVTEKGDTLFSIRHTSAYVQMLIDGFPEGIDQMMLVPTQGAVQTIPVAGTGPLVVWMAKEPGGLPAAAAVAEAPDGRLWSARLSGRNIEPGVAYRWTGTLLPPEAPDAGLRATPLSATLLDIDPGEYSGITWLGGNQYAVVDDNLKGGGILRFAIPIDEYGNVGTVLRQVAPGTAAADGKKRDTEGVAFVPSESKLYVTSEKHQEIRAYDLNGNDAGVSLKVPKDLKGIVDNQGFEALTYNETTGLFWTTTEAPLKADTFLPRILRLQSFDREGKPSRRYFYQTDEPSQTSQKTVAYVFGVPALAALDDGRLLVLEREVYVPQGTLWEKLQSAFTDIHIYVVDPVQDTAGILRKSLLCSFTTGALNLANFEGMCLGPVLPDGRRTLVLIADSQKGSGGLTNEYVKVILFR
jgi:predicted Rdx family selenoprotein